MNENSFVEFGFSFIKNAFSFQRNIKALFANSYPLVEIGFPLADNGGASQSCKLPADWKSGAIQTKPAYAGFKTVRAGGLRFYSRDFQSPGTFTQTIPTSYSIK